MNTDNTEKATEQQPVVIDKVKLTMDALNDALSKPAYRLKDETFEAYKMRQKIKNMYDKKFMKRGRLIWDSSVQKTFRRE